MKAIEIFSSWQGEGLQTGQLITFVRFKFCARPFANDLCPWCDTKFKMNNSINFNFEEKDLSTLLKNTLYKICFTGGEPTIYLNDIDKIYEYYKNQLNLLSIETNGYKLEDFISWYTKKVNTNKTKVYISYSPKFFNEQEVIDNVTFLCQSKLVNKYKKDISIKIPMSYENQELVKQYLNVIKKLETENNVTPENSWFYNLYLMPIGANKSDISNNMSLIMNTSLEYNCNVSGRSHIDYAFL